MVSFNYTSMDSVINNGYRASFTCDTDFKTIGGTLFNDLYKINATLLKHTASLRKHLREE